MACRMNQEPGEKIASDDENNKKGEKEEYNEEVAKEESLDTDLGPVVGNKDGTTDMSVSRNIPNGGKEEAKRKERSDSELDSVLVNRDGTTEMSVKRDNCKDENEKAEKKGSGDKEKNKDKKKEEEIDLQSLPFVYCGNDAHYCRNSSQLPLDFRGHKFRDVLEDLLTIRRNLNNMGRRRDKGVCPCNLKKAQNLRKMLEDVRKRLDDIATLPQTNETKTEKRISYAIRLAYARISDAVALMERTVPDPKPKAAGLVASMIALIRFSLRKEQKASYPNGCVVVSNMEETSRALQAGFRPTIRQCFCEDPLNLVAIRAYVSFAYSSLRVTFYLSMVNLINTGGTMGDTKIRGWKCSLMFKEERVLYTCYYYHLAVFQDCTSTWHIKQYAVKDSLGLTALHLAVLLNRAHMLPVLLRRGISPNTSDADTNTPIHAALVVKDVRQVKALMSYGADIYTKNKDGISALHLAICMDDIDLLNSLLVDPKHHPPFAHLED